jgi:hypothetical protein
MTVMNFRGSHVRCMTLTELAMTELAMTELADRAGDDCALQS